MNAGAIICTIMAMFFLILALVFAALKSKGAILISGFNTLPKEQRDLYDKKKMSTDYRNMFALWCAVFLAGVLLSQLVSVYMAIAAFIVWMILLFSQIHLYPDKAFEKYKL